MNDKTNDPVAEFEALLQEGYPAYLVMQPGTKRLHKVEGFRVSTQAVTPLINGTVECHGHLLLDVTESPDLGRYGND